MKKIYLFLLAITTILITMNSAIYASTVKATCTVKGAPYSDAADIGEVYTGEVLRKVIEQEGSYYYIEYNTSDGPKRGYALKTQITLSSGLVINNTAKTINKDGIMEAYQRVEGGPDKDFVDIGTVFKKEKVRVLRQDMGDDSKLWDYYFIEYSTVNGKKRGHVMDDQVFIANLPATVKINATVKGAPYSTAVSIGTVFANEVLNRVIDMEGDYYFIDYKTSSGPKRGYALKTQINIPADMTIKSADNSIDKSGKMDSAQNVEAGPDAEYVTIGSVNSGETVRVLKSAPSDESRLWDYYFIEYNTSGGKKRGYVRDDQLTLIVDNTVPTAPVVAKGSISQVLYGNSTLKSRVTCGFDGYKTIRGRHEGIDFAYGAGKSVYSVISGNVIKVLEGSSTSLSMICIYDSAKGKTVIYMHLNPSVAVGATVSKGTKLGTESSRGNGGTHTHIEVRNGETYSAAKSVGDMVLDNANPRFYWNSKGYSTY